MKQIFFIAASLMLAVALSGCYQQNVSGHNNTPKVSLARLDCGSIFVKNLAFFSSKGQYKGEAKQFTDSCYLIRHGQNILLWDTGVPASAKTKKIEDQSFKITLEKTLTEQLATLNLAPKDITHVAISHGHFDHAANLNMFKNATLIIQRAEYDFIKNSPNDAKKIFINPDHFSHFMQPNAKIRLLDGDTDLFNDGTLMAIGATGHTPGHMALLVKTTPENAYLLSGDQWHFHENRTTNDAPIFNVDYKNTLNASDKLNKIIKQHNATLIIQHEPKDIGKLSSL